MDAREWRHQIEVAKNREAEAREKFMQAAADHGIEYAAEWDLKGVTEARMNLTWWTRIEKRIGPADARIDPAAIEEILEVAHDEILRAYTNASTNPVANVIKACERDTLARWYREAAGMLQRARRDEAAVAATTAEVK